MRARWRWSVISPRYASRGDDLPDGLGQGQPACPRAPFGLDLDAEIKAHDAHLEALVEQCAPTLVKAYGIKGGTAAEMLVLVGDNPERIHSEGALAKLCGASPIPASSGKVTRYRLNRGGNRQANAALHRVVVVRMRGHQPTIDYVRRRTAEGKSKAEIIRCLKRFVVREIFGHLCRPTKSAPADQNAN